MSRWVFFLGVGMALVAGAFVVTDQLLDGPGPTEANFKRLRLGMTPDQAKSLVGAGFDHRIHFRGRPDTIVWLWSRGEYGMQLQFDNGFLVLKLGSAPKRQGPLERLRAWLGG